MVQSPTFYDKAIQNLKTAVTMQGIKSYIESNKKARLNTFYCWAYMVEVEFPEATQTGILYYWILETLWVLTCLEKTDWCIVYCFLDLYIVIHYLIGWKRKDSNAPWKIQIIKTFTSIVSQSIESEMKELKDWEIKQNRDH